MGSLEETYYIEICKSVISLSICYNQGQILQPLPAREINIRHRSIIRRVGSRLPLKPARRIQVQVNCNRILIHINI